MQLSAADTLRICPPCREPVTEEENIKSAHYRLLTAALIAVSLLLACSSAEQQWLSFLREINCLYSLPPSRCRLSPPRRNPSSHGSTEKFRFTEKRYRRTAHPSGTFLLTLLFVIVLLRLQLLYAKLCGITAATSCNFQNKSHCLVATLDVRKGQWRIKCEVLVSVILLGYFLITNFIW